MAIEPDQAADEVSLGRPVCLDPIGREIARMKVGDALFVKAEEMSEVASKPRWRRRVIIVIIVAAILASALVLSLLR